MAYSEVPERSRKNFEMTFFDDFPKIYRFFLSERLNDPFWPVTNKCRSRVVFGLPIKWSGRTNKSTRPDHNIPFEMIPLN